MRDLAISIKGVSQRYRLYNSPLGMVVDALALRPFIFWRSNSPKYHDALLDINLEIHRGERVGIIGRNGAGKTTLLKLITQNYEPTKGEVKVVGRIQSLMDQGVGFHPEFTGRENIRSSLMYNGAVGEQARQFEKDIIEFVELGEYIDQPLKTYSLGMKARLGFATATAIKPEILIIDEVMGAGDAYFASKSASRMKLLTGDGVTLILVSHSNSQILQFCDRVIWIDGGRVSMDGPALEVVKAYDRYILELENSKMLAEAGQSSLRGSSRQEVSRWKGSGEIEITSIAIRDANGSERAILRTGESVVLTVSAKLRKTGRWPCIANVFVYTNDGRPVCQFTSDKIECVGEVGQEFDFSLRLAPLLLGNGDFVLSTALYSSLDYADLTSAKFYDLIDRSFKFKAVSDFESDPSTVVHPGAWVISAVSDGQEVILCESEASILGRKSLGDSYRKT